MFSLPIALYRKPLLFSRFVAILSLCLVQPLWAQATLLLPYAPLLQTNLSVIGYGPDGVVSPICNYGMYMNDTGPGTNCGASTSALFGDLSNLFSVRLKSYQLPADETGLESRLTLFNQALYYGVATLSTDGTDEPSTLILSNSQNQQCTIVINSHTGMPDPLAAETTCLFYTVTNKDIGFVAQTTAVAISQGLFYAYGDQSMYTRPHLVWGATFLSLYPSIGVNGQVKQWFLFRDNSLDVFIGSRSSGVSCVAAPTPSAWDVLLPAAVSGGSTADFIYPLLNALSAPPYWIQPGNYLIPYNPQGPQTNWAPQEEGFFPVPIACNVPNNKESWIQLSNGSQECSLHFNHVGNIDEQKTSCTSYARLKPKDLFPQGPSAGCMADPTGYPPVLNGCQASSRDALDVSLTPVLQGGIVLHGDPFESQETVD